VSALTADFGEGAAPTDERSEEVDR